MLANGRIKMLRIEVDGHFHGSGDVPKPWVARITGVDPRFGLRREFVQKLNDFAGASRAWSGNLYGVVASFPLREGNLYEVSRLRGRPSRRHVAREFVAVRDGKIARLEPEEALAAVEAHDDPVRVLRLDEGELRVVELAGVGAGEVKGWVVVDGKRCYRLRQDRLYEVTEGFSRRLVLGNDLRTIDQKGALEWLAARV